MSKINLSKKINPSNGICINNIKIKKLRWNCRKIKKPKCKQQEYQITPKLNTNKEMCIQIPILRIPFDHEVSKIFSHYFYNVYLSFDTYQGIKPLSKCDLNNFDNINNVNNVNNVNNPNYRDIFYHKIQELDNHIKRTLSNNSKKMFNRSLSYQEVNDLYIHSVIKEYYRYPQSDLFQVMLPCQKIGNIKPKCSVYNSNGKKSRASLARILRRGSKLSLTIQLKYITVRLPPKNVSIGKIPNGITSSQRIDEKGLIRYSKYNTKSNSNSNSRKYYIRPKWEIKRIIIDKLSNRKTNTIEPSTLEPFYAFLSDSE